VSESGERDEMSIVRVDAARPHQRDGVEHAAVLPGPIHRGMERRPMIERAVGDRRVDPGQVLKDRLSRPEIQVTDLGIAHLT